MQISGKSGNGFTQSAGLIKEAASLGKFWKTVDMVFTPSP